jgi:hypothetical protein
MMAEDNNDSDSIPEEKIFSEEAKEDHEVVARKVFLIIDLIVFLDLCDLFGWRSLR